MEEERERWAAGSVPGISPLCLTALASDRGPSLGQSRSRLKVVGAATAYTLHRAAPHTRCTERRRLPTPRPAPVLSVPPCAPRIQPNASTSGHCSLQSTAVSLAPSHMLGSGACSVYP